MKRLYLIRHAKAGWDNPQQLDFERPLTPDGIVAAEKSAEQVAKIEKVDRLYHSPARRTTETANIYIEKLNIPQNRVEQKQEIYDSNVEWLLSFIEGMPDSDKTVVIIGHNPMISWLATQFSNAGHVSLPTGGIYALEINTEKWMDVLEAENRVLRNDSLHMG